MWFFQFPGEKSIVLATFLSPKPFTGCHLQLDNCQWVHVLTNEPKRPVEST